MPGTKCPGAASVRQPFPEEFKCSKCGYPVEIWSDEFNGNCPSCGKKVLKDGANSCLDWCKFAEECVGGEVLGNYRKQKVNLTKEKLLSELAAFFGEDQKRIDHAKAVLATAQEILKKEDADWHIVIPASILHDVGIKIAEEKYGSSAAPYQEKEGPPVAKKILLKAGYSLEATNEICEIIGHHHTPGVIDSLNFKVLYDADFIVNSGKRMAQLNRTELEDLVTSKMLTAGGRKTAIEKFS